MMKKADNQLLVIFGASGDLTKRKLLPSLFELYVRNLLPEKFRVLGASRTAFTDEEFREEQRKAILDSPEAKPYDPEQVGRFLQLVHYLSFDSTNEAEYGKLKERIEQLQQQNGLDDRIIYYLATPPVMYESVPVSLQKQGLNKRRTARDGAGSSSKNRSGPISNRPNGSARNCAKYSRKRTSTGSTIIWARRRYRISWFCVSPTASSSRSGTAITSITVEISATETLGVENRGKYYEGAGALRDMIQNHLMQLMAFVAMENPGSVRPGADPRRNRQSVPRHPPLLAGTEIGRDVLRAQYTGRDGRRCGTSRVTAEEKGVAAGLDDRDLSWR